MVILKVPIWALYLIVRWAIRQTPETELGQGQDGGIGPRPLPRHPSHPRPRLPHATRRGPHGGLAPASPARVRVLTASKRLPHR